MFKLTDDQASTLPDFVDRYRNGRPDVRSTENVKIFLHWLNVKLRYNNFLNVPMIIRDGISSKLDQIELMLMLRRARSINFRLSEKFLSEVLYGIALEDRYHPLVDWLDSLKWDGKPRLDNWLTTYLGAKRDNEGYHSAVGVILLVAAVAYANPARNSTH